MNCKEYVSSVVNNVAKGRPRPTEKDIIHAAKMLSISPAELATTIHDNLNTTGLGNKMPLFMSQLRRIRIAEIDSFKHDRIQQRHEKIRLEQEEQREKVLRKNEESKRKERRKESLRRASAKYNRTDKGRARDRRYKSTLSKDKLYKYKEKQAGFLFGMYSDIYATARNEGMLPQQAADAAAQALAHFDPVKYEFLKTSGRKIAAETAEKHFVDSRRRTDLSKNKINFKLPPKKFYRKKRK